MKLGNRDCRRGGTKGTTNKTSRTAAGRRAGVGSTINMRRRTWTPVSSASVRLSWTVVRSWILPVAVRTRTSERPTFAITIAVVEWRTAVDRSRWLAGLMWVRSAVGCGRLTRPMVKASRWLRLLTSVGWLTSTGWLRLSSGTVTTAITGVTGPLLRSRGRHMHVLLKHTSNPIKQGLQVIWALCAMHLWCIVRWRRRDNTDRLFRSNDLAASTNCRAFSTVTEKSSSLAWRRRNWDISGFRSQSSNLRFKSHSLSWSCARPCFTVKDTQ